MIAGKRYSHEIIQTGPTIVVQREKVPSCPGIEVPGVEALLARYHGGYGQCSCAGVSCHVIGPVTGVRGCIIDRKVSVRIGLGLAGVDFPDASLPAGRASGWGICIPEENKVRVSVTVYIQAVGEKPPAKAVRGGGSEVLVVYAADSQVGGVKCQDEGLDVLNRAAVLGVCRAGQKHYVILVAAHKSRIRPLVDDRRPGVGITQKRMAEFPEEFGVLGVGDIEGVIGGKPGAVLEDCTGSGIGAQRCSGGERAVGLGGGTQR